jgi:hypothetical protein
VKESANLRAAQRNYFASAPNLPFFSGVTMLSNLSIKAKLIFTLAVLTFAALLIGVSGFFWFAVDQ